jgi:glycyl-tRNA synthetase beta chain
VNPDLLSEPQEQKLYKAYREALETIDSDGNVGAFLSVFEPIAPTIAEFFDKVLVNAEDTAVRQNRLGLLQTISAMQNGRADLSELAGF